MTGAAPVQTVAVLGTGHMGSAMTEERGMSGNRHAGLSGAMPAANERDDPVLACGPQKHSLGHFAGIGPGQSNPDFFLKVAWRQLDQPLSKLDTRFMYS